MTRVIICIGIIAVFVTASLLGTAHVCGIAEEIAVLLDEISEGGEGSAAAAREAESIWNGFYEKNYFLTDKEHAMEITVALARIEALAAEGSEELKVECRTAKKLVLFLRDKQVPDFIFWG